MLIGVIAALLLASPAQTAAGPAQSSRIQYAIAEMVAQGLSQQEADALFRDSRLEMLPPQAVQPRTIDWDQVIKVLLAPASLQQGADFLARYERTFDQVEARFNVPRTAVTALLRLESNLGRNTGKYRTFDVFYTLLSEQDDETHWKKAADNLAALAVYCKNMGRDCFQIRGSYAGALGAAQFLPVTVTQYGADGNGDNVIDPFAMEDAIASAANYLAQHGWSDNPAQALAEYYGTSAGYPEAVLAYALALQTTVPPQSAQQAAGSSSAPAIPRR